MTTDLGVPERVMLIGGELRQAEWLDTPNPATGQTLARIPRGGAEDVDDAVAAARAAFPGWWATPPLARAACLERLADAIAEHADELAYSLTASVFTRDLATAHAYAREVEAGYVWVNDSAAHFPGAPFGGVKESGVGREESLSYSQVKNVNVRYA